VLNAIRTSIVAAAVASPFVSHMALATGAGAGVALPLAGVQALAAGLLLWGAGQRWLAVLGPAALLGALWLGARHSAADGLLAGAGVSHALLYGALLAGFGVTLLPGRVPLVTAIARRLNPNFHAGMEGYTRGVTAAWCGFFAGQIVVSALLLWLAPVSVWGLFVTILNLPLVVLMALVEYAVRRRRFPGEARTPLLATIRVVRSRLTGAAPRPPGGDTSP